ncbi:SDR family oxidoreductase [Thalassorhabdomicrobium marinisediminis]|uniref:Short chain dehydrogenase n=1 Tax=Thalassorhabdomicrobium marinisediminis TaxID=2170577 RepID=A0A2T7FU82_9RHOB|nr:SDR family oxidoreductase [Thalassorhabdomicrobium marinisediminis]PVA05716.1 short chain dehydrogenase [Thalassorhabdomicrobium marinisediminis]
MTAPVSQFASQLTGKVAIVTGGSRGIGAGIAAMLLDAGADVAICGRTAPETLPEGGGKQARFWPCDVRDPEAAAAFVQQVAETFGRLDILINNAGGAPAADAATVSPRFHEKIVALNLMAPIHMSQAAHRWLVRNEGGGSIVNIASVSGTRPSPGTSVYGAAKAGLLGLTRSLAAEWGPDVRVNAIVVGLVDSGGDALPYGGVAARDAIAASLPLKRLGVPQDVAAATVFLSSPMAAYVSGAVLEVHGGGERPLFLDLVERHAGG